MAGKVTVATEVVKIPIGIWRNITELVIAETLPSSSHCEELREELGS
jgi:hypothetical protein